MIKGIIAAVLLLILADVVMTHGENTKRCGAAIGHFAHWVAHMGDGSIFAA